MIPAIVEVEKNLNIVMVAHKNKIILLIPLFLFYYCTASKKTVKEEKPKPSNHYSYYSMGIIEQSRGNVKKAIYYFKKSFNIKKTSEAAHEISSCYLQMDNTTNAKLYIKKAISLNPNNVDHRFMLVNIYLLDKENKKAIDELKLVTQIQKTNHEAYFDIASIYQNMGNHELAIQYYNKTLELNEKHPNSLYNLGNIYFTLSQKRKAKTYFAEFVQQNPDDVEAQFIYAYLLSLIGEYKQALEIYNKLYKIFPGNQQLIKDLAEIHYIKNNDKDALLYCKKIEESLFIKESEKKKYQAINKQIKNKNEKAEKIFLELIQINPNDHITRYGLYKIYLKNKNFSKMKEQIINLGKVFYYNENYEYAIKFFKKYKKYYPKNTSPYSYLGIIYESMKEYDKAIKELKNALKIEGENIKINYYLGVLFEANKEYKNAIKQYNKVIKLDEKHLYAYLRLGYLYNSMNDNKKNIKTLKKALKLMPEKPDIYLLLGIGYARIDDYPKAINTFQEGLKLNSSDIMLHFQLAAAYDKNGEKNKAIEELKTAYILDKSDPEICNYLAYLFAEEGKNLNKALKLVIKALEQDEKNFAYLDTLGWVYYKLGEYKKASIYLEEAKDQMEKEKKYDSVIYEHLVAIYEKIGAQDLIEKYKIQIKK